MRHLKSVRSALTEVVRVGRVATSNGEGGAAGGNGDTVGQATGGDGAGIIASPWRCMVWLKLALPIMELSRIIQLTLPA